MPTPRLATAIPLALTLTLAAACSGGGDGSGGGGPVSCQSGACPAGQLCDPSRNQCVPSGGACSMERPCPAGQVCDLSSGAGVCKASSTACSSSTCTAGACFFGACTVCDVNVSCPASGATCDAAASIDALLPGPIALMGDFGGKPFTSDVLGSGADGYQAVFAFDLAEPRVLTGDADFQDGLIGSSRVWILRADCATSVVEALFTPWSEAKTLAPRYLPAGKYFVVLFSDAATARYAVRLRFAAPDGAPGNSCEAPLPLVPDASGAIDVSGDLTGRYQFVPDEQCTGEGRGIPEVAYRLDLPERSYVLLSVAGVAGSGDYPTVELKTDCSAPTNAFSCNQFPIRSSQLEFGRFQVSQPLEAGTYAVVVHGDLDDLDGHPYTLKGRVEPWATNDTCGAATPLVLASGAATAQGDGRYATGSGCGCGGNSYWCDEFFSFSTASLGDRSAVIRATAATATSRPLLTLLKACGTAAADSLACDQNPYPGGDSVSELRFDALPPGDYWVGVAVSDAYDVQVTLGEPSYPPVPNDTCTTATTLDLVSSTVARVVGDTRGAADDVGGSCGPASAGSGGDAAFRAVLPGRGTVKLDVAGQDTFSTTSTLRSDPVIRLDPACSGAPEPSCVDATGIGGREVAALKVDGTSTAFWVDSGQADGPYTVRADFVAPPANDLCSGAEAIVVGEKDDLSLAFADPLAACASTGPDVYYKYTWTGTKPGTVTVSVSPTGFDAVLRAWGPSADGCTPASCPPLVDAGGVGVSESASVALRTGETAWFQVGARDAGGPYGIGIGTY
ncbi:hypothetical protein [Anaeromyxobacter soli]|uniref:hypothetical protein n=1 Tax=Anaeromyxobacter soli TaxID=2922725 RepID=UPI001FB0286D|nr:hypothetical protein [Anaeromyxobacter sp. SG29]